MVYCSGAFSVYTMLDSDYPIPLWKSSGYLENLNDP